MKTILRLIVLLILSVASVSLSNSSETQTTSTFLSVLNVREDLLNQKTTNEILLFGKFSNGKYEAVSRWDNKQRIMVSQRKSILEKHKKFKPYSRGIVLGEITVSKVSTANFDCEELVVGTSQGKNIIKDVSKYQSSTSETSGGFNQNGNFEYKNTRFLAINSDSPSIETQRNSIPLASTISEDAKQLVNSFAIRELMRNNNQLSQTDIKISSLLSYDFNNDNKIEYLAVAKGENDNTKESGIFVMNIEGNHIIPLLNEGMNNRPSSWGNGYELLDVLDIDGDTIPELIFEAKGYESTGYDIFKLEKNKFIKVFTDVTYGC